MPTVMPSAPAPSSGEEPLEVTDKLRAAFQAGLVWFPQTEPHLKEAVRYTLAHPGSLIRARLVYSMARAYDLEETVALPMAIGLEYFHTASLLFDDLPCMDDAQERRGAACAHQLYGEAASILAALGLINRAYGLIWETMAGLPEDRRRRSAAFVESCLGLNGVLNGQSLDLHHGPGRRLPRQVLAVALGKTVSLIRLALVLPALLAGAPDRDIRAWQRLATWWGLSYQMLDDLKDVHGQTDQTGKTAQRDGLLNRPNLALTEGTIKTVHRVLRLVRLGDRVLRSRTGRGDSRWAFLGELRKRFASELQPFAHLEEAGAGS